MPKRGSVQFLLLPSRPRAMRWLGLGAIAIILLLVGVVQLREQLPLLGDTGLTQALRQSVWEHALAGQSDEHWPWEDAAANASLAPAGTVRQLGLSAAVLKHDPDAPQTASIGSRIEPRRIARKADKDPAALGDVAISDVAIGDSITFTAADGATCVYRVTGRRVVDPHLAASEAERSDSGTTPFICSPLDRLILQATQGALTEGKQPAAPQAAADQQKL